MANAIQNVVAIAIFEVLRVYRHQFNIRVQSRNRMANSVKCHPLTIVNHETPQKRRNRCIEDSSTSTKYCTSAKNSWGRITVHDVPKMKPNHTVNIRTTHHSDRRPGTESERMRDFDVCGSERFSRTAGPSRSGELPASAVQSAGRLRESDPVRDARDLKIIADRSECTQSESRRRWSAARF